MAMKTWVDLLGLYGLSCVVAAFLTAKRHDWRLFPILPLIPPVFQISYGLGFLIGLAYWPLHSNTAVRPGKIFTDLTR